MNKQVLIPVYEGGGFGDIMAAIAIEETLEKRKIPTQVYFKSDLARKKYEAIFKSYKYSPIPEKEIITICPSEDDRTEELKEKTDYLIRITEYDRGINLGEDDCPKDSIVINTGLGDNTEVSAGLYVRENLERKLKNPPTREKLFRTIFREKDWEMSEKLEPFTKDADLALYYPSELAHNPRVYLSLAKEAAKRRTIPLIILGASGNFINVRENEKICKELGINYFKGTQNREPNKSDTYYIELEKIKENTFQEILSKINQTSLITGDHSLTQVIQKSMSQNPVPYFYLCAQWKIELAENIYKKLKKTDEEAATIFGNFLLLDGAIRNSALFCHEELKRLDKPGVQLLRLFTDEDLKKRFNYASKEIKKNFILEKQKKNIKEAEMLWSVQKTVANITQKILQGANIQEAIQDFLPKED